jgi:hypothetical protein
MLWTEINKLPNSLCIVYATFLYLPNALLYRYIKSLNAFFTLWRFLCFWGVFPGGPGRTGIIPQPLLVFFLQPVAYVVSGDAEKASGFRNISG